MPSISRTDKQNNDFTSTALHLFYLEYTFISLHFKYYRAVAQIENITLTVPGQQLFVIHNYDIPLRRFLLVCFSLFFKTADWDSLMLVRVVKAEQPFCRLLDIKLSVFVVHLPTVRRYEFL